MNTGWFWYSSPQTFFPVAGTIARICAVLAAVLTLAGLYVGFFVAPTDAQQGEAYRIIFIHVPAAWMSMFIYVVMAMWAALGLALNTRLSFMMARALAPTGALFTFIALQAAIDERRRADRAGAVLAIVGVVNIPIIYYSVKWWNTLHQGASVSFSKAPSMAATMFIGMILMALCFWAYSIAVALTRVRCEIAEAQ